MAKLTKKVEQDQRFSLVIRRMIKVLTIVGIVAGVVMVALLALYIVLKQDYYFYALAGVAIAVVIFFALMVSRIPNRIANLVSSDLTSDMTRAINSAAVTKGAISLSKTGIIEFDDLKKRFADYMNGLRDVTIIDRKIDDSVLKFGYEYGYKFIISHDSFYYNLPYLLKLSAYSRSALIMVQIVGADEPTKENIQMISDSIKETFGSSQTYIGLISGNTLAGFILDVESISVFKNLCYRLYSSFSYLLLDSNDEEDKGKVLTCKIGAAIYPYSTKASLFLDAQEALDRSKDVMIFMPTLENLKESFEMTSLDDKRRRNLIFIQELMAYPLKSDTNISQMEDLWTLILDIAESMGFEAAGLILANSSYAEDESMFCAREVSSTGVHYFSANKERVHFEELKPLLKACDKDLVFYSTKRQDLEPEVAQFYDNYDLSAFYASFVMLNGKVIGVTYFASGKQMPPLTSVDSDVMSMAAMVVNFLALDIFHTDQINIVTDDLDAVLKIEGKMRYVITPDQFNLQYISAGLADILHGNHIGEKCYKVLFGLERPCDDCPFIGQENASKELMQINSIKYQKRKLSYDTLGNSSSVLLTPVLEGEQAVITEKRFDANTFLSTRYAFNSDMIQLVQDKNKGTLLLICLEGIDQIVETYNERGLDDVIIEMRKRVNFTIKPEKIYRYDDGVLAIFFPEVERVAIYDIVENIHAALTKEYSVGNMDVKCHFRYLEINFTGNLAAFSDLTTMIAKGLIQVKELPDDYLAIAGEKISRLASKNDYVMYLMDANYLNRAVEFRVQPIVSVKNDAIKYGEILMRVYDVLREEFLSPIDVVRIVSSFKNMGKFDSLNYQTAVSLYNKYSAGIFRMSSFAGFSMNVSDDSLDSNEWLRNLRLFIDQNMVSEGFLSLEINESSFKNMAGRIKVWLNELRPYRLRWAVDNYADENISPRELADLGFNVVKFSRKFLMDAQADPVQRGLFESVIRECHYNKLTVVFQGVENKDMINIAKATNADYVQGYALYRPLKIDEFIETLSTRRQEADKAMDETATSASVGPDGKPIQATPNKVLSKKEKKKIDKATKKEIKERLKAEKRRKNAPSLAEAVATGNREAVASVPNSTAE